MKISLFGIIVILFSVVLYSCLGKDKSSAADEKMESNQDTLLTKATWYLYSLNSAESSHLVNLVDEDGNMLREKVPIVTVPFKLGEKEMKGDTITYTYFLRDNMNPAGTYNALFYKITFVKGKLFSAQNDGGFIADLRNSTLDSNTLFISELKRNKGQLTDLLRVEATRKGILE